MSQIQGCLVILFKFYEFSLEMLLFSEPKSDWLPGLTNLRTSRVFIAS